MRAAFLRNLVLSISTCTSATTTAASDTTHTVHLYYQHIPAHPVPNTNTAVQPLATLQFTTDLHPSQRKLLSFTPPTINQDQASANDTISIIHFPSSSSSSSRNEKKGSSYSSTAAPASLFLPEVAGRFALAIDNLRPEEDVRVLSAGYYLALPLPPGGQAQDSQGEFDVLAMEPPLKMFVDRPAPSRAGTQGSRQGQRQGGGQDGDGDGEGAPVEQEKTFFQRYWWLILGAVVLALTTGGDK